MNEDTFIGILEKEMVPALGCTDPVGVAYAAAYAKKYAGGELFSISGELSANIIKNAAAVVIPKTGGMCGISLAVALGAIGGNADKGLEVLADIRDDDVKRAKELIAAGRVDLRVSQSEKKLYMKIRVKTQENEATVTIGDSYTRVTSVVVNKIEMFSANREDETDRSSHEYDLLSLENILNFAEQVPLDKLKIIQKAVEMNLAVAEEGLSGDYGVSAGKSIHGYVKDGKLGEDLVNNAMMWTAAATDARMAGCEIPVVSNTGSGNQGLASTIPVIAVAKKINTSYEKMIRAVAISSLITIYIKNKMGILSATCGAVIASAGTSCGVVYLLGGGKDNMVAALQSTFGNISGILCDGAKAGCALKVATCTNAGVLAALLAMDNHGIKGTDGIVGLDEEKTISNFIQVAQEGMNGADKVILDIILKK